MQEITLLVLFDIPSNRLRNKIIEKCKDYGLFRIQRSCFKGSLPVSMKSQFLHDLKELAGSHEAAIIVQPVCSKCLKGTFFIENPAK